MTLTLRPHSTNLYAFSKLLYKCNTIAPSVSDLQHLNSAAKKIIYADLLIKPSELILYRDISQGGLGLTYIKMKARAAPISTFLETAINPRFIRNNYHNLLYRCRILSERAPDSKPLPALMRNIFQTIRKLRRSGLNMEEISTKQVYDFLMITVLKTKPVTPADEHLSPVSDRPLKPLKWETDSPNTDWNRTWRLSRQRGLGPDLTSFTSSN